MAAQVRTVAFHGIEVIEVEAQVTITSGLPAFATGSVNFCTFCPVYSEYQNISRNSRCFWAPRLRKTRDSEEHGRPRRCFSLEKQQKQRRPDRISKSGNRNPPSRRCDQLPPQKKRGCPIRFLMQPLRGFRRFGIIRTAVTRVISVVGAGGRDASMGKCWR
jgi:hypothetical protein